MDNLRKIKMKQYCNFTMEQQKFCENISVVECNKVNVKISDSQLNNVNSAVQNHTGVI